MTKIYAVASQKGGVGKTTTAISLAAGLTRCGKRVLLIDADAQGSLTAGLGFTEPDRMKDTLAQVMEKEVNGEDYDRKIYGIIHHREGFDLLPCNIELSGLEVSLVNVWSRETILRKYINGVKEFYEYIIIDCMPSLSLITINALAAADRVIIPVQAAYLSIKGLEQLIKTIGKVKRGLNRDIEIDGILITMMDARTNFAKDIAQLLGDTYGEHVRIYKNRIPFSVKAAEATAEGVSIFTHDPKGKVADSYRRFTEEVLFHE